MALAVGAMVAGFLSFPPALGGTAELEHFLAPSFTASGAAHAETAPEAAGLPAEAEGSPHVSRMGEIGLMAFSVMVALIGIFTAYRFYVLAPEIADRLKDRYAGAHNLLYNKYYVDELYDAAIVQPIRIVSESVLWKVFDARIIDGAVNGVAESVGGLADLMRRVQTGSVRAYAASVFLGVVLILGYYAWR